MKKDKIKKILKYVFCISILLIICLYTIKKAFDNDLFFDIKTGESLLKYGLDFKDHFSFIPNLTYLYHHYLYSLFIYFIYHKSGFAGTSIFFLILYSLYAIIVFCVNKSYSKQFFLPFMVSLLNIIGVHYFFTYRVQSITYILFFLEVFFLERLYVKGEKKYLIFLIISSILIANIHMPLWIFTIILMLPYMAELIAYYLSKKHNIFKRIKLEKPKNTKLFIIGFIILALCGFVSPLAPNHYTFFIKALFNSDFSFIQEMNSTVLFDWKVYLLIILAFIISGYFKLIKLSFRNFCLLFGIFVFSLMALRNVAYAVILLPTIYIMSFNNGYKLNINGKAKRIVDNINWNIIYSLLIIFSGYIYINLINRVDYLHYDFRINELYPVNSVKYLKENVDYKNIKLYNAFDCGSYIEFYDIPVFIDSRAEVFIKDYNGGKDIIGDYSRTFILKDWKKIFDKYGFDYALVYKDSNIDYGLDHDKSYEKVMEENDLYALYKKVDKK